MGLFKVENIDGLLALIGGFGVHLTLGTLYCFGNMNTYMTSYMKNEKVHPDIVYSDTIWILTLATVGQGTFMTLSGYLEEFIGIRMTVLTGCFIMTCGVYLTYFAIQMSLILTVITYGFMFGFGTALAYAPPMGVAMRWFPRKKGLVNGVILGGFGLGAFVFNQIQTFYLNPKNEEISTETGFFEDEAILSKVPSTFLLLGSIYGVIQILSVFLINSPGDSELSSMMPLVTHGGEDEDEEEENDSDMELNFPSSPTQNGLNSNSQRASTTIRQVSEDLKPRQVVRSLEFWILWGTFVLNTQAIGYINSMYKAYGQIFIVDDHFLAVVGALAAVFNSCGRIFWGHLCDTFGYRVCIMVISALLSCLYGTFIFVSWGASKALFAFWVWAIFFCFCGNFVLLPTATAQCFGTKYLSKNYGLVMTGQAIGAPILAILTQLLHPLLGWLGMFLIISLFSLTSCLLNWFFPSKPSPKAILERVDKLPSHI